MAELATIARPYAEALFKSAGDGAPALKEPMALLAALAADPALRQFAENPKVTPAQVADLVLGLAQERGGAPDARVANLLRTVVENGRLAALPEIAAQYAALANEQSGVADATIYSAHIIELPLLDSVVQALERRFGRRLNTHVVIDPELIGGIRVVVGDEVLDASVRARLEQMRAALVA